MKTLICIISIMVLSGCGVAQKQCLAPCYSEAIDEHLVSDLKPKDALEDCDLRDMKLLTAKGQCQVKCQ